MQYLAALGLDRDDSVAIYDGILVYRRFSEDLFIGTPSQMSTLRTAIEAR
jgi:hypothetical protein